MSNEMNFGWKQNPEEIVSSCQQNLELFADVESVFPDIIE